jgi:hypothetical protein
MKTPRMLALGAFTLAFAVAASSTASADVRLTIQNGRVSLVAKEATLRQILAEWAKVGQIKIVNGERVPGGPLTVQFNDVPEQQVLDTLLRTITGYVAQPREIEVANLSRFDRIVVMPTVAAPVTVTSSAPAPTFPQAANPTFQQQPIMPDDQEDDRPAPNRGPVFNTFPQPQVTPVQGGIMSPPPPGIPPGVAPPNGPLMLPTPVQQAPTAQPGPTTAYPGGVSVPGMIVPAPPQPGQPGATQQKKPGGGL